MSNDINVGAISEALNNKLDLDGNNKVIPNGLTSIGFPSNRYIDLQLGASRATYIAPANGYFVLSERATNSNQAIHFKNNGQSSNKSLEIDVLATGSGNVIATFCPASKGDNVVITYTTGTRVSFYFVYAEGERI